MEPSDYSIVADMLAKFHTSPELIQALWLLAVPFTIVGVTWCVTVVLREAIRAVAGLRADGVPATGPTLGLEERRLLLDRDREGWPMRLPGPAEEWEAGAATGVVDEEKRG